MTQPLEAQITAAKLKPRLRQLALHLLRYAGADGYVGMSVRDMYMSISGTEPGPGGFVQVNYHEVGKAMETLHKAGIVVAYMYDWVFQADVVMRLAVEIGAEGAEG